MASLLYEYKGIAPFTPEALAALPGEALQRLSDHMLLNRYYCLAELQGFTMGAVACAGAAVCGGAFSAGMMLCAALSGWPLIAAKLAAFITSGGALSWQLWRRRAFKQARDDMAAAVDMGDPVFAEITRRIAASEKVRH